MFKAQTPRTNLVVQFLRDRSPPATEVVLVLGATVRLAAAKVKGELLFLTSCPTRESPSACLIKFVCVSSTASRARTQRRFFFAWPSDDNEPSHFHHEKTQTGNFCFGGNFRNFSDGGKRETACLRLSQVDEGSEREMKVSITCKRWWAEVVLGGFRLGSRACRNGGGPSAPQKSDRCHHSMRRSMSWFFKL